MTPSSLKLFSVLIATVFLIAPKSEISAAALRSSQLCQKVKDQGDLRDTGVAQSSQTSEVKYAGKSLESQACPATPNAYMFTRGQMMKKSLVETFESPTSAYRGKPFWAWNGKLEEGELRRQIRVMKQMGLGGFFMHSRVGLATPYLSKEWFDLIAACTDEAKKLGMEAWLYDEDRWPSGAAGGIVTKEAKNRLRFLAYRIVPAEDFKWESRTLAAFSAKIGAKDTASNVTRLRKGQAAPKNSSVLTFAVEVSPDSPWFNGGAYLDTLSRDAVKEFMSVTHEAYRKHSGKEFGKTIPGIFTDEPAYAGRGRGAKQNPWTDKLPQVFRERYGYDLIDHLPEIFFDVDGKTVSATRHDYFDCITFLFTDAFARQIGDWCEENGIAFIGHIQGEQNPRIQTEYVGSAMRFYEHMQVPGIDILTEFWHEYDTAKQCASVVNQMGRTWMLSEMYACTGWYFPFEGHKAVGDWQAALGVNVRCQHLAWYTMQGEAKRDFPASILYQSPWWALYGKVEDYFSRIGVLMTQGRPVRDLLVIHPIESTWVREKQNDTEDLDWLDASIAQVRDLLLQDHFDFDYGDEEMLSRLASVVKSKDGARFRVGKAQYRAILVPPMLTMRATTLDLLKRFTQAGGLVIFAGAPSKHVGAALSDEAERLADATQRVGVNAVAFRKALAPIRTVSITDTKGKEIAPALYMLRADANGRYLFVCNTDREKGFAEVRITLDGPGYPEEWDPSTGERFRASSECRDGKLVLSASLPPSGSVLFRIPNEEKLDLKARPKRKTLRRQAIPLAKCSIQLNEDNVLVLDQPEYRIGDGEFQPRTEILKVDRAVRSSLKLPWRSGEMLQPWARKPVEDKRSVPVRLRYTFGVDTLPSGRLDLAFETPEVFTASLNGHAIDTTVSQSGWWTDRSIHRVPVDPAYLVEGKNTLELACAFDENVELEASFLLGNFGVRLDGPKATLIRPPATLSVGDWTAQGLPFYAGAVTYRAKVKVDRANNQRAILCLPRFEGACVRVQVDGKDAGVIGWPPYELDITDLAESGEADLAIEVYGSRHNAFGPLHITNKHMVWVGAGEYMTEGKGWQDDYNLKACGVMAKPVIEYALVEDK